MPIEDIDESTYEDYVLHLKSTLDDDISINSYLRDLIAPLQLRFNLKRSFLRTLIIKKKIPTLSPIQPGIPKWGPVQNRMFIRIQ